MLESILLITGLACLCYALWGISSHISLSRSWKTSFTLPEFLCAGVHFQKPHLRSAYSAASSDGGNYPRLSRRPSSIKPEYDVVVIGSGYGGGVAASRMARAGRSVCVLERGKEGWPGNYPYTFKDAMREYSVTGRTSAIQFGAGEAAGLYHTVKGNGQDVFLGRGLGGTSLINAGVFLRPDERLLKSAEWPKEIREDTEALMEYYKRAENVLQPTAFPPSRPTPCKSVVFEQQAKGIGFHDNFYRPPLTTTLCTGINQAGVHMLESTGSGNECTGANDGSKNSVLVTYLSDAWARGAEFFGGIDVRHVKKKGLRKGISYSMRRRMEARRRRQSGSALWVGRYSSMAGTNVMQRELVFLGAGALGTTEILLRSQRYGFCTSPLLGQRLTGNGDMLAFAYNCDREIGSIGLESSEKMDARSCGPTITSCIDMRSPKHAKDVRDGYVIQDGAVPESLGPVIQGLLETQTTTVPSRSYKTTRKLLARLKSWILGPYAKDGSVNRTLVFLTISHDENEGTVTLDDDTVSLQWSGIGNQKRSANIDSVLLEMTDNLGGKLVKAPCITVHPLGGAVMSNDATGLGGVVDHRGQVFTGKGDKVHEGIFGVDGSIMPTSLGVNPCATIAALAERSCDLIMKERGWTADDSSNGILDLPKERLIQKPGETQPSENIKDLTEGVQFEETMLGHVHIGNTISHFEAAELMSKMASSSARLTLTVDARRVSEDSYKGMPQGTFACGAISQDPLLVTGGTVEFFTPDKNVADAVDLVYKLDLLSTDGARYELHGYKRLDSTTVFSASKTWAATTTLLTTISGPDGSLVGRGVLYLSLYGFLSELWSLRSRVATSAANDIQAQARFLGFFARNIASYMFSPFRRLQYPSPPDDASGYYEKAKSTTSALMADDGVEFPIKIWHPPSGTLQKRTLIVLIPGASVDEQIFSLPTISTNTIDYFTSLGHRCYVPVLRFGKGKEARKGDTVYDARLDVRAAMQYIREKEQGRKIYVIAHCLGSIATGIALLTGDVEASWIEGMACSQVFINLIFSPDNDFKARHPSLIGAYKMLAGSWFPCHSSPSSPWVQFLLDQILRFYPTGTRSEMCNSSVCHRCDVPFGRCWTHANLNRATHTHLGHWFGGIHMNFLSHLSGVGALPPHHVRSNKPAFNDLVTPENLERLRGLRICWLSGGENAVWNLQSTQRSYDLFRQSFPEGEYERVVVQGYGHLDCWMGDRAHVDVFPRVERHLRRYEGVNDLVTKASAGEEGYVYVKSEPCGG